MQRLHMTYECVKILAQGHLEMSRFFGNVKVTGGKSIQFLPIPYFYNFETLDAPTSL